jgi:Ca2+-binding RTX toxin-like protein
MPDITVAGAHNTAVSLTYSAGESAVLAAQIAAMITAGVKNMTILPADSKDGPPPPLAPGQVGEFVASTNSVTFLSRGYDNVVVPDTASSVVIFGSGDANQKVLAGSSNLNFNAAGGSGTVAAGDGNDQIVVPGNDPGNWLIVTGQGDESPPANDTIRALGSGDDSISAGSGNNYIQLGSGSTQITTNGNDTVLASSGSETIGALQTGSSPATDLVYGNSSMLFLLADGGATVFGGTGSDTVFGGTGPDLLDGGTAGNNFLQAGSGPATLFAGGNGDQLYAGGSAPQQLYASFGSETLTGAFASGQDTFYGGSGNDQITGSTGQSTFVLGTGNATISAIPSSSFQSVFDVMNSQASGRTDLVTGLTNASQLQIQLTGYGPNEAANALAGQTTNGNSVSITLSDNTIITFENITHLTSSNFS